MTWDTLLTDFPGVGEVRAKKLEKLGLRTAGDLLGYYPRDYEDRRQIHTIRSAPLGVRACICAMAAEHPRLARIRKGMELVQLKAVDASGAVHLTFFNQGYVQKALRAGEEYIFYGAMEQQGSRRTMASPIFERVGQQTLTGHIVPIYHLTAGVSSHMLATLTRRAVGELRPLVQETLPAALVAGQGLMDRAQALEQIHFPRSEEALEEARRRLAFEELFYLALGLALLKGRRVQGAGTVLAQIPVEDFFQLLPFAPTGAQRRVMKEVAGDLSSGQPMNRLVQGDVGSGKTAVAAWAALTAVRSGCQAAMMAPTEVLAEQHHRSLSALLAPAGVRLGLLTGSMPAAEKRRVRGALAAGEIDLAVGTHALLSEGVEFSRLALAITDEQHRFGVGQRAALSAKSEAAGMPAPHVLVMSATPIPRTLALIIYGDLEVSVIDELPPGRTPIQTVLVGEDKRQRMYGFVRKLVGEGRQVYIVCPAVEESEEGAGNGPALDLKAVTAYAKTLREEIFPELTVDLLHGKMRPREKERVMSAFAGGATQVLVSTTVIEVGVDVPNAALMIVENAERFGLSQLHQLRGRVGRGGHQSYCVLCTASHNPDSLSRLRTLAGTTDGFKISEEDLKLRGPGDFFGSRQHGLPQLRLADLAGDMRTLSQAQEEARSLLERDPDLSQPEDEAVLGQVRRLFQETADILN